MPHAHLETVAGKVRKVRSNPVPFKVLLFLILSNMVVAGFGDHHPFMKSLNLWLNACSLALALHASGVGRKYFLSVASVVLLSAALWRPAHAHHRVSEFVVVMVFNILTALAPIAILWRIHKEYSEEGVDAEVVLGTLCAYLYIGGWFSLIYRSVEMLGKAPFFAQPDSEKMLNYLYFSFTTLTTTGFGDLSPAYGPGRMLAVLEAVIGQIYLVSVVAIVIGAFRRRR